MASLYESSSSPPHPHGCLSTEQMVKFIAHELSDKEVEQIEAHLKTCSLCTAALENLDLQSDKGKVEVKELEHFQEIFDRSIDKVTEVEDDDVNTTDRGGNMLLRIAAILVVLFIPAAILYYSIDSNSNSNSNENLFASNFEPYQNVIAPITMGSENTDSLTQAMVHYEAKRYAAAIPIFEKLLQENPDALDIAFYTGISYLALGNTDKAALYFEKVLSSDHQLFSLPAKWYQALNLIKMNKPDEAKLLLMNLAQDDNAYQKKAGALLEEME